MSQVTPYKDGKSKKDQVRSMFDNVAGRYDLLNRLLSMGIDVGWRRKLIKKLRAYNPVEILDMATGTSDLAIMAAKKIPGARVTGIDLSPEMIAYGDKKVRKANLQDRVQLRTGDSEDLNEPDNQYDGAMVAFGVRDFENLDRGSRELRRVLKPGAPLFVLEFSKPTIFPVKQVFNTYFRFVVPFLGKTISKDSEAYTYLYDSVQAFPDYDEMQEVLEKAGFKECEWEALSFGICCLYKAVK